MEYKEVPMPDHFDKTDWDAMSNESLAEWIEQKHKAGVEVRLALEEMKGESLSDFDRGN